MTTNDYLAKLDRGRCVIDTRDNCWADTNQYLAKCQCGRTTSIAFARAHEGRCKRCAAEEVVRNAAKPQQVRR